MVEGQVAIGQHDAPNQGKSSLPEYRYARADGSNAPGRTARVPASALVTATADIPHDGTGFPLPMVLFVGREVLHAQHLMTTFQNPSFRIVGKKQAG